jgi:hypothetical protein
MLACGVSWERDRGVVIYPDLQDGKDEKKVSRTDPT